MIKQIIGYKSKIKKIEEKYPEKIQQYKALQKYGETIGLSEHQLHYYAEPFEQGIEEQLPGIKDKIRTHCEIEMRKFWSRIMPYVFLIIIIGGLIAITLGIIHIVVSSERWTMYPQEHFHWRVD